MSRPRFRWNNSSGSRPESLDREIPLGYTEVAKVIHGQVVKVKVYPPQPSIDAWDINYGRRAVHAVSLLRSAIEAGYNGTWPTST